MTDDRNLDNSAPASRPKRRGRRIAIGVVIALAVIALAVFVIVPAAGRFFTAQETAARSDWFVETGDLLTSDEANRVNAHTADLHSDLMVVQLVPEEIEDEGFTYYNVDVQDRLAQTIEGIKSLDVA